MATVATAPETACPDLTAADVAERFGPIPLRRIVGGSPRQEATEDDLLEHLRRTGRGCELIDGILVEKDMSWDASAIAAEIIFLIKRFLRERRLCGKVAGEHGNVWLPVGRIRMPDVAYVSAARLRAAGTPRPPVPRLVPELAIEVLSPGNTRREMETKLDDYFASGVELVWYVDPPSRTVRVFTARDAVTTLGADDTLGADGTLGGGSVLPGFAVAVADLFDEPEADPAE